MDSLQTLRHHRDVVALETFSVQALDVTGMLKKMMPDIKTHFSNFISRFSSNDKPIPLSKDNRAFIKLLEKHNYVDLEPIAVDVPEGLDVDFLAFAHILNSAVDHAVKVQQLLNTYTTYLAMLITNEFQRFETKNSVQVYQGMAAEREQILKEMGACFKQGSHETKAKYGDMIQRNKDWELIFGESDKLSKTINSVGRDALNSKVKEAAQLMDKVIQMLKDGKMESTAHEVAQELSEGAYQIASELEFFSVVYYRVLGFVTAVNSSAEKVREILE
jgi:hypothetical protein